MMSAGIISVLHYGEIMLNQKFIIYTRFDGGVDICSPSLTALRFMTTGGGRWDGFDPGFLDRQINAHSQHGIGERIARTFVHAMQFGGHTHAEAYGIMRDRFCTHLGTGCELWNKEDLQLDRWFRDAWKRSQNGGPIYIDMRIARKIQLSHLRILAKQYDIDLRWPLWRERIRKAKTPEQLKQIWLGDLRL